MKLKAINLRSLLSKRIVSNLSSTKLTLSHVQGKPFANPVEVSAG